MSALRSANDLQGDAIVAQDGAIGFIIDVYFDDQRWKVRYLVVDTGRSMPKREVLIASAKIVGEADDGPVRVSLTRAQVERSPEADSELPVYRQHELTYAGRARSDPHLRSSQMVSGCGVEARDGAAGHVEDFVIDPASWTISGIVVGVRDWLKSRRVLLSPEAVESIDWPYRKVHVRLTRDAVRELPAAPA